MAEIDTIAKVNGIRFRHFHEKKSGRLVATIATRWLDRTNEKLLVSMAFCSKKDIPSKLKGKQIALGRLDLAFVGQGKFKLCATMTRNELINAIKGKYILDCFNVPHRIELR